MTVNLCAAHKKTDSCAAHEVLLVCFLQLCSTQRWISCSARNIACMLYTKVNSRVIREFGLSHSTKKEHTRVPARECQLRRELYCKYVYMPLKFISMCLSFPVNHSHVLLCRQKAFCNGHIARISMGLFTQWNALKF